MNPNLHTFIANSAQLGIKADFFKIMSNIDFALATGATGIVGYWTGSDLQNGIQNVISVTTQYKSRNYAELHRRNVNPRVVPAVYHGEPFHLTKAFFDPTGTTAVISASSIAMVGTGLKMIEMGGGVAALSAFFSGAEVASAAAGIFLSGGTILVILGFAVAAYAAYRIMTQIKRESGPWIHPDSNPGDPPYLQRIYAKPSIFPPQMSLQPYVTSTIHYLCPDSSLCFLLAEPYFLL